MYNSFIGFTDCNRCFKLKVNVISGGARLLLLAGHRQVISFITKGSQNILMHNFVNPTFDCQGGSISVRAFALARPGVMPPLNVIGDLRRNWRRKTKDSWKTTEEMREQIKDNTKKTKET